MGMMDPREFQQLWNTLNRPVKRERARITRLERRPSRAETAGAVEVVTVLPTVGIKGRLLYLETGDASEGLYVDHGTTWEGPY